MINHGELSLILNQNSRNNNPSQLQDLKSVREQFKLSKLQSKSNFHSPCQASPNMTLFGGSCATQKHIESLNVRPFGYEPSSTKE